MSIPLLSSDVVSDTCHQACLYYKCMLNIKWSKLVRTCHSSLQSTLSCHRKPLIPDCKMEIKAETFFLESSVQWSSAHIDQCGRCPECITVSVYHYITPLQSMARGVFYSSRMVCSTVQVLWGHSVLVVLVVVWCVLCSVQLCKCFEGTCGVWADSASGSILRQWDILLADVCRPGSLMISLSCLMIWVLYSLHGRSVWRQVLN